MQRVLLAREDQLVLQVLKARPAHSVVHPDRLEQLDLQDPKAHKEALELRGQLDPRDQQAL